MNNRIFRSIQEPIREDPSFEERLRGPDKGLIIAWEVGRKLRKKKPELAEKAEKGELPKLGYKGGIDKKIEQNIKYGSLNYLAQWQGLRGKDLNIDFDIGTILICTKTNQRVAFSSSLDAPFGELFR
ncbi:hypothetical protein ACFLZQ_07365 [Thermodesulfobacteriota bacterium]